LTGSMPQAETVKFERFAIVGSHAYTRLDLVEALVGGQIAPQIAAAIFPSL
jgi:hypothetical protein